MQSLRSMLPKRFPTKTALLFTFVGGLFGYERYSESYILTRTLRTIDCGLLILYSYKWAFDKDNYLQIHEKVAEKIYKTCLQNDGLYVKFGQGIAAMEHLLPPPFYKHLSKLQDKAKAASYQQIKLLFEQQVGQQIEQVFSSFEKQPIASASLAQVHKAILRSTGEQVAVKIQKPRIKKQFKADMYAHYMINWILEYSFDLPLLQFVDDIQLNLKKQLDFKIQAENAKQGKLDFQRLGRDQLYVPRIIDAFTRERVMVSEWIDGIKITDINAIRAQNLQPKAIMQDTIRGFAQQIFITGFIHCDPHPGNIFVRKHPKNEKKHQIIILDFGLCLKISDQFRTEYGKFWKAMFMQDQQEMKRICEGWGMRFSDEFAGFNLMRPYNSQKLLTQKVAKEDVIKAQLRLKQKMRGMMNDAINFPKELLFISRNMNIVRSLNKFYKGIADRIPIMAKAAYVGSDIPITANYVRTTKFRWSSVRFTLSVWLLQFIDWFMKVVGLKSVDQYIEDQSIKKSRQMFEQYGFKPIDQQTYAA